MKILAIGAHPDDIEYGCGGTLLKAMEESKEKVDVYLGILTGPSKKRTAEQICSKKKMQARSLLIAEFEDTKLEKVSVIQLLDVWIKTVQPTEIFTHWWRDSHQDHECVSRAAFAAVRRSNANVYMYESVTSIQFAPTVFVDIKKQMKKKEELIQCYRSQITEDKIKGGFDLIRGIKAMAEYQGLTGNLEHAEGFSPYRIIKRFKGENNK